MIEHGQLETVGLRQWVFKAFRDRGQKRGVVRIGTPLWNKAVKIDYSVI